jgi:hypothetical protein
MLELVNVGAQVHPETGQPQPGTGAIKQVENYSSWVLRKFLGLTDDELEMFTGHSDAGKTPEQKTLQKITDADERGEWNGVKSRLARARAVILEGRRQELEDDTIHVFDPLPKKGEDREDDGLYDLEEEIAKLSEVLGVSGAAKCPVCEGELETRFDESDKRTFLYCSSGTCGFAAYADPDLEMVP